MDRNHPYPETNLRVQGSISKLEKSVSASRKYQGSVSMPPTNQPTSRDSMYVEFLKHSNTCKLEFLQRVHFFLHSFGREVWESKLIPNGEQSLWEESQQTIIPPLCSSPILTSTLKSSCLLVPTDTELCLGCIGVNFQQRMVAAC